MAKTQLRGICQCCGRQQAVVDGTMSKHGYTVKTGWFQGVCSGNHFAPMEISRDRADAICASVLADCVNLDAVEAEYKAGTLHPKNVVLSSVSKVEWKDAPEWMRKKALVRLAYDTKRRAELGRSFAKDLAARADAYHGKELVVVTLEEPLDAIHCGDVKKSEAGSILTASNIQRGRVYWKSDKGRMGWTGIQAWRRFANVEAEVV